MVRAQATIRNEAGIHCRPSTHIVKTVRDYDGKMNVTNSDGETSDLCSMLSLMILALGHGSVVTLEVDGPQEEEQLQVLVDLFEFEYDFPPQNA